MDSRIKELISNTFFFALSNLGSKVLVFLMVPFYTYVLSPDEYGIASVIQTIGTLLLPLLTAKIQDAVLRFCYIKNYNRKNILSLGVTVCFVGSIVSIFISFCLGFIPIFHDVRSVLFFVPLFVFSNSFYLLLNYYSRGIAKVKESAISGIINTLVVVVLNLLFLLVFKWRIEGYLSSFIIADIISFLYLLFINRKYVFSRYRIDKSLGKEMLLFSLPLIPTSLSWWLLGNLNNIFILSALGSFSVGLYSASLRVPSILTALSDIFSQAWLLSALRDYGTKENRIFIKSIHQKFFSALCMLTGGIILFTYPIARLLLQGDFIQGWRIVPLLFVAVYIGALTGFYGSIFSAEKKTMIHFRSTIIGSVISVVIVLLFLRSFGLLGIPFSTVVGHFVIWLIRKESLKTFIDIGMSTFKALIIFMLLISIAIFVIFELYICACLVYCVLFIINYSIIKDVYIACMNQFLYWLKMRQKSLKS